MNESTWEERQNWIYETAPKLWGGKVEQTAKLAEEAKELHEAALSVAYWERFSDEKLDHLADEIADVEIMIEQIKRIWHLRRPVGERKMWKLERVEKMLKEGVKVT